MQIDGGNVSNHLNQQLVRSLSMQVNTALKRTDCDEIPLPH
jgi:hypothetical protein